MVRVLAIFVAGLVTGVSGTGLADPAADLQTQGQQLAKDGRYTEAIDAFKAADRLHRTASHACLIALAYTRRELWSQAEIFLATCHQRATPTDPLPDWVPLAEQQIAERVQAVAVAPIAIAVDPADATAWLTVSSFAPDESFEPRTIHLPLGHHVIIASAPGYEQARQEVDVQDKTPQNVVIKLHKPGDRPAVTPVPSATTAVTREPSKVPYLVMAGGATLGLVAVIYQATAFKSVRDKLTTTDPAQWDQYSADFDSKRNIVIGLYAASAVTIGVGVALKYTLFKSHDEVPAVSFVPQPGGGVVSLGWQPGSRW